MQKGEVLCTRILIKEIRIRLRKQSVPSGAVCLSMSAFRRQVLTHLASMQEMYSRRKRRLLLQAMELSVLCDCEIGIVMFGPGNNLCQYASTDIGQIFRRFSSECFQGREMHDNRSLSLGFSRGIVGRLDQAGARLSETGSQDTFGESHSGSACTSHKTIPLENLQGHQPSMDQSGGVLVDSHGCPSHGTPTSSPRSATCPSVSWPCNVTPELAIDDEKCYERIAQQFDHMCKVFQCKRNPRKEDRKVLTDAKVRDNSTGHSSPEVTFPEEATQKGSHETVDERLEANLAVSIPSTIFGKGWHNPEHPLTPIFQSTSIANPTWNGLPSPTDFPWIMLPTPRESIISASAIQAILEEHPPHLLDEAGRQFCSLAGCRHDSREGMEAESTDQGRTWISIPPRSVGGDMQGSGIQPRGCSVVS